MKIFLDDDCYTADYISIDENFLNFNSKKINLIDHKFVIGNVNLSEILLFFHKNNIKLNIVNIGKDESSYAYIKYRRKGFNSFEYMIFLDSDLFYLLDSVCISSIILHELAHIKYHLLSVVENFLVKSFYFISFSFICYLLSVSIHLIVIIPMVFVFFVGWDLIDSFLSRRLEFMCDEYCLNFFKSPQDVIESFSIIENVIPSNKKGIKHPLMADRLERLIKIKKND